MNIFSVNWWISTFITTLVTMCFIFMIKRFTQKFEIPVVSQMAAEV